MMNGFHSLLSLGILFFSTLMAPGVSAQIAHGGQPTGWGLPIAERSVAVADLGAPPEHLVRSVLNESRTEDAANSSFSYGFQRFHDVDVIGEGTLSQANGKDIRRLRLRSPGAMMLSVQFDEFRLQPGAEVFLYSAAHNKFIGAFTEKNMNPSGGLATSVLPGDEIMIEYRVPSGTISRDRLHIASVTHGVRNIFKFPGLEAQDRDYYPGYSSAPCHNNVACPVAADWQDQASSVGMFLRADGNGCTGTMLNNTAQDGTPYFYFANHCNAAGYDQWVFYFNYQAPACVGDTGITTQTVSGSTLRSAFYFSDHALVELFNAPPASYNIFYAGWDRTTTVPTSTTCIMHPLYDVKKIVFDHQPPTSFFGGSFGANMWGTNWDDGLIEPVGSGCALFDQNKRVRGSMTDALGDCNDLGYGESTHFADQWVGANSSNNRLSDWLDPGSLGNTVLDGAYFGAPPALVQVQLKVFLEGPFDTVANLMHDSLRTLLPAAEPYSALGHTHVGDGGGEVVDPAVLAAIGSTAIVDWILVELRDKSDSTIIVASKSALLRRDGMVVDVDGVSNVTFGLSADDHYIAIRHRDHLGIMTASPIALSDVASLIDLSDGSVPLYGLEPIKVTAGVQVLWAGDTSHDGELRYTGTANDRDLVLQRIGGMVPTNTASGYFLEDVNMNGVVSYTGTANDRDPILVNIGGAVPTNTRKEQLP